MPVCGYTVARLKVIFFLFLQGKKVEQTENSAPAIAVGKSFFSIFFFSAQKIERIVVNIVSLTYVF